ncbi:MAG: thiol:disulfide interchange protein DsbA/DsbL [Gammaproteobacteria bacterium]|nr:thiol:disulfide interchange protein DsbA/DsbL [Gammaproteobacteria bacterium]
MKRLLKVGAMALGLAFLAAPLHAEDYVELAAPQPTGDPSKIEVVEMFSYACPHCYHFDPQLHTWIAAQAKDVTFISIPVVFRPTWEPLARAYFVAEMLGVLDKLHGALFKALHEEKQTLETEDAVAKVFVAQGVDEKQFRDAYNSFSVAAKLNRAKQMTVKYGINGVPTLVINGKYRTSASEAGSAEGMLKAADRLIAQERAARKP